MKSKFPKITGLKRYGRAVIKNVRAFDIETDGLGGDFLAVGWMDKASVSDGFGSGCVPANVHLSSNWHGFLDEVLLQDSNSLWTAHNLGGYESLYFFEDETAEFLIERGWNVEAIGPKGRPCLLILTREDREIKVWDSYSLIRMPLKDATAMFNERYTKIEREEDWSVAFDLSKESDREYLRHDVLSLQEVCSTFRAYFKAAFNVEPGYSLPSSGVRAFRRTMPHNVEYRNITNWGEEKIRNAYRGGRVIVRDSFVHKCVEKYDFNSMYPAVMRDCGVPVGNDYWSPREIVNRPGYVNLIVDIPRSTPPWRCVLSDSAKRFPTGVFETWCATDEWEQAKEWGAELLEFKQGIYFDRIEHVFTSFVDLCERLRTEAKRDGKKALEKMVKLCQNSLYGKFGQRRDVLSVQISAERVGVPITVSGGVSDYVYEVPAETASNEIMPHWAAWITAQARLRLCRSIDHVSNYFVYADTDSILVDFGRDTDTEITAVSLTSGLDNMDDNHVTQQRSEARSALEKLPIGKRYGELKHEGTVRDFFTVAPKTYSGYDGDTGEHVCAAKGIPKRAATRDNLSRARLGDKVRAEITSVRSLKSSVKYGKELTINRTFPTPQSSLQYRWSEGEFVSPHSDLIYTADHVSPEAFRADQSETDAVVHNVESRSAAPERPTANGAAHPDRATGHTKLPRRRPI